jgi:hypothetical protein
MRRSYALIAIVVMTACARVEDPPPRVAEAWETAGGSRLRPIFVTLPGGVRSFVAFEDRLRGERCTPTDHVDAIVCLPDIILNANASIDATCTAPMVGLNEHCDGTRKLISVDGALFTAKPVAQAYFRGVTGCQPLDADPRGEWVAPDQPVSVNDFVHFERRKLDVGGRVQLDMLMGSDGSRYVLGVYDSAFETACFFVPAVDGVTRCMPFPRQQSWDETCSARVVSYRPGTPPPRAVSVKEECATRAFSTSDLGEINLAYRDNKGACVATGRRSLVVRVGEELPADRFEVEKRVRVGDTRVTQWVREVGVARLPSRLEDRELGGACEFILDRGAYRCLPRGGGFTMHTDAACTQPVACRAVVCGAPGRYAIEPAGRCAWTVRPSATRSRRLSTFT